MVVLVEGAVNFNRLGAWKIKEGQNINTKTSNWNQGADCRHKANIFSMKGAQTDLRDELRLPNKWDSGKGDIVAISGLG